MDNDDFKPDILSNYSPLEDIGILRLDVNDIEIATDQIEEITRVLNTINTSYQLFSDNCVYVHNVMPVDYNENDSSISFYDNQSPDLDKEVEYTRWEDMILKGVKN